MAFLLTLVFVLGVHVLAAVRAALRLDYVLVGLHFLFGASSRLVLNERVLSDTLDLKQVHNGYDIVLVLFWFAALSVAVLGARLARIVRIGDPSPWAWRTGLYIWALAAALYHNGALFDHALFAADGTARVVDPAALGVRNVACSRPVLARLEPNGTARYRCPLSVVWTGARGPFIPWPSYNEGTSAALAAALLADPDPGPGRAR